MRLVFNQRILLYISIVCNPKQNQRTIAILRLGGGVFNFKLDKTSCHSCAVRRRKISARNKALNTSSKRREAMPSMWN